MSVLSLLNPLGWFSGDFGRYRPKLSGGQNEDTRALAELAARGRPISAESAMQVSAFWSCVKIISETIAALPLQLFATDSNGGRKAATDHPLYALLHDQPSADHTAIEMWQGAVAYMAVGGNAYVRKDYIGSRLVALTLLRLPWMSVFRDSTGAIVYRYADPVDGQRDYSEDEIMPLRGFGFGDIVGLSPLSYARRTLGVSLGADEAADATFANGMKMSGWFKYKGGNGILKPDQREQARRILVDPYVGAGNAAKVGILEGDFDWVAASMPLQDAQLLESRRFGVEDVCRWFGVPPILIGHAAQGQTMWGTGVEQIMLGWLETGLNPYLIRIEQAIKKHLLSPADRAAGLYAEFKVDGLLRTDSKARTENYSRLSQNGIMTRNEIRALENLAPVAGGDALTVQTNLVPIDKLGELASLPRLKPVVPGGDDVLADGEGKTFNPSQPRDAHGQWTEGGGSGAGTSGTSGSRAALSHEIRLVAGGVALTAAAALVVAVAPEAGAAALAIDVLAPMVTYRADSMFVDAGISAGREILKELGVDTSEAERAIGKLTALTKADKVDGLVSLLKTRLRHVADFARDELVAKLKAVAPPADRLRAATKAIDASRDAYKAKLAA